MKDHLGNTLDTKAKLCEYWGIKSGVLNRRLDQGYSLWEALTAPVNKFEYREIDDFGMHFKSLRSAAALL